MDTNRNTQGNEGSEMTFVPRMKEITINSLLKIVLLTIITIILWIRTDGDYANVSRILTAVLTNKTLLATCDVLKQEPTDSKNFL